MMNTMDIINHELCVVIVNFGLGSKIVRTAEKFGVTGSTILLGRGTVENHILEFLALNDIRKEIVFMIIEESTVSKVLEGLNEKFAFRKPNHGIAFSIPVVNFLGSKKCQYDKNKESRGADNKMYDAIFTIVDRGKAENVIDAAVLAGSKGGTIINGRGSGIHEKSKLFSMVIEPEKEIIMVISEKEKTDHIVSSIREHLEIDRPGNGIMFILDINEAYGLI
ncbi:P-II family nitrogen regulator [Irregularibacter muris]|uniref:P-II family nitrogen regulator n=1 Tax=Irregularibacter muris TaxID=1796619 RepID=A0AAE3HCY8_9FIRM|nr:P-II family nitrogen regulator [Irregularibacter muris]MCR1897551.1 P-II family nitrogen regulator [Irregularibacter muris]